MYSPLVATALAVIAGVILYPRMRHMQQITRVRIWASLAFGAFVGGWALCVAITCCAPVKQELVQSEQLVAMRTADGLSGTFVLGSGSISTQVDYLFYVQNADGSVSPRYLKAEPSVKIFQTSASPDRGEWNTYRLVVDPSWFLAGFTLRSDRPDSRTHVLIVPPGTVVQQFSAR